MIRLMRVVAALAALLRLFSFAFLVPIPVAFLYEPLDREVSGVPYPHNALLFLACFLAVFLLSSMVRFALRQVELDEMLEREGYLTTALAWILMPAFGLAPLILTGTLGTVLDAYFEATSGLTTTGFSVITDQEAVATSVHFWRAFMEWLGGIGIILVFTALLSRLTQGGMPLFQAEASAHAARKLRPKLAATARILLGLYAGLTLLLTVLFFMAMLNAGLAAKVAAFDAVFHAFTSIATAGFSTHSASLGFYDSVWVELVAVLGMLMGATPFGVLVALRRRELRAAFRDPEWRFFLGILAVAILLVWAGLVASGDAALASLRHAAFVATSLITTTGLSTTADWSFWPVSVLLVLLIIILMGGCAGSTAGGLKAFRILVLLKIVARQLVRLVHPRAVVPIRMGRPVIAEEVLGTATAFTFTFLLAWVAGSLVIAAAEPGLTALEAVSGSGASIANAGNAIGAFGPTGSVAAMTDVTKVTMIVLMWFGRLELFTALLLFYPSSWRN